MVHCTGSTQSPYKTVVTNKLALNCPKRKLSARFSSIPAVPYPTENKPGESTHRHAITVILFCKTSILLPQVSYFPLPCTTLYSTPSSVFSSKQSVFGSIAMHKCIVAACLYLSKLYPSTLHSLCTFTHGN